MNPNRSDPRRLRGFATALLGLLLLAGLSGCRWLQDEFFFVDRPPPQQPDGPLPW